MTLNQKQQNALMSINKIMNFLSQDLKSGKKDNFTQMFDEYDDIQFYIGDLIGIENYENEELEIIYYGGLKISDLRGEENFKKTIENIKIKYLKEIAYSNRLMDKIKKLIEDVAVQTGNSEGYFSVYRHSLHDSLHYNVREAEILFEKELIDGINMYIEDNRVVFDIPDYKKIKIPFKN